MAVLRILDLKKKRHEKQYPLLPAAVEGARIKICATGCSHCSAMRDNVREAVRQMDLPEGSLQCVSSFEEIAKLGVMSTPSLIVDGRLVSAGKVLKPEQIIPIIKDVMNRTDRENYETEEQE